MELRDLNDDERLALAALIKAAVLADRTLTAEEDAALQETAGALGDDAYRAAMAEADRRFRDDEQLRAFLPGITRREARDLIYGTVPDLSLSDGLPRPESALLSWLAHTWGVEVRPQAGR